MNKRPRISVVMPVYNTSSLYLQEAVESILNQTYRNFELLIIDDCSKDEQTLRTLQAFTDPRIIQLKMPQNSGAAAARNLGLSSAKGEFIAFLDSDDVALADRFEKQINFLEHHPEIGVLGSWVIRIPEQRLERWMAAPKKLKELTILADCPFCQSAVMLRREILEKNNIQYREDIRLSEDHAFWIDLSDVTEFSNLQEALTLYRWHESNISRTQTSKQHIQRDLLLASKWEEMLNLTSEEGAILKRAITCNPITKDEISVLHTIFQKLLEDSRLTQAYVRKVLGKQYMKMMRKSKSRQMALALLQSPLTKLLDIRKGFKFKIRLKSLFLRG